MELLFVRHAIAEDRAIWHQTRRSDRERPLIERGRERWRIGVLGLKTLIPSIDLIVSSPLTRARETATILLEGYPGAHYTEQEFLAPGSDWKGLIQFLGSRDSDEVIALVGHEPDMSGGLHYFAPSGKDMPDWFKKAGVACVSWDSYPEKGNGSFQWYQTAKALRQLGGSQED